MQAAWYEFLTAFVVSPHLEAGERLLVDGWYYKLFAKLFLRALP